MPRRITTLSLLAAVALAAVACGGASDTQGGGSSSGAAKGSTTLSLVAYSTPQVVYDQVIPQFNKTSAGEGVAFRQSYGASGDQSRAVAAGQKADIVAFLRVL